MDPRHRTCGGHRRHPNEGRATRTATRPRSPRQVPAPLAEISLPKTRHWPTSPSALSWRHRCTRSIWCRSARRSRSAFRRLSPHTVTFVGLVGAGLMARQLAVLIAEKMGVPVHLVDIDEDAVTHARTAIATDLEKRVDKRRLRPELASRLQQQITVSTDRSALADADLVIEAVVEDLRVKKQVFADLEGVVRDDCVLATNTSSLPVSADDERLAAPRTGCRSALLQPRCCDAAGRGGARQAVRRPCHRYRFAVTKQLKKSGVLVVDSPGFVVNRVLIRLLSEVMRAVDEGTDFATVDSSLDPLGMPMSPFALLELVGTGVAAHVVGAMHQAFPERFAASAVLISLATGAHSSVYDSERGAPSIDPAVAALVPNATTRPPATPSATGCCTRWRKRSA